MICEDKVKEYCRQALFIEELARYRKCKRCCLNCNEPCGNYMSLVAITADGHLNLKTGLLKEILEKIAAM